MEQEKTKSVYATLSSVNCNGHTEKKNGLTYLSWAWAWAEVKKAYPSAAYTIYENKDGLNYHHDGRTAWVKTGVTIDGLEHIEYLPIMDFKNRSIALDHVTSYDVNKSIQRSLTKACARHGLGLYIYAGEDLPEGCEDIPSKITAKVQPTIFKGKIAWEEFKRKSDGLEQSVIVNMFAKLVLDTTGKTRTSEVSDAEWDKILDVIKAA